MYCIGLYGAVREDYCSLLSFIICIGLAILFELFLGVSAFAMAQKNTLASKVGNKMTESMEAYNQTGNEGVTKGKLLKNLEVLRVFHLHIYFTCTERAVPIDIHQ